MQTDWNTGVGLTASQLMLNVRKIASEFKRRGFQPGRIISCLIHSDVNYFTFLLATWMSGCILSALQHSFPQGLFITIELFFFSPIFFIKMIKFDWRSELLVDLLRKSQTPLLLCDHDSASRCLAARAECGQDSAFEIFIVTGKFEGCTEFSQLLESEPLSSGSLDFVVIIFLFES